MISYKNSSVPLIYNSTSNISTNIDLIELANKLLDSPRSEIQNE